MPDGVIVLIYSVTWLLGVTAPILFLCIYRAYQRARWESPCCFKAGTETSNDAHTCLSLCTALIIINKLMIHLLTSINRHGGNHHLVYKLELELQNIHALPKSNWIMFHSLCAIGTTKPLSLHTVQCTAFNYRWYLLTRVSHMFHLTRKAFMQPNDSTRQKIQ